jgi:hypothetical protein
VLRARECEIATAQAIGGFLGSATVCGRCTGLSFFFDALLASSRDSRNPRLKVGDDRFVMTAISAFRFWPAGGDGEGGAVRGRHCYGCRVVNDPESRSGRSNPAKSNARGWAGHAIGDTNRTLNRSEFASPLMQRLFLPLSRPIPSPCKGHITVVGEEPGFLMFVR